MREHPPAETDLEALARKLGTVRMARSEGILAFF